MIISRNILPLIDSLSEFNHNINCVLPKEGGSQLLINGVTIGLGLLAGLIALYQVKSNVISSSRIKWIEDLRLYLSEYCVGILDTATIIQNIIDSCKEKSEEEGLKIVERDYHMYFKSRSETDKLCKKIILHLNTGDKNQDKIEKIIKETSFHINKKSIIAYDTGKLENKVDEIIKVAKVIFRDEWKKSKKIFRI